MNLDQALSDLLPAGPTGDLAADLRAAVAETWRRRKRNTEAGAAVLWALLTLPLDKGGMTLRMIQEQFGIPKSTVHRWATPPGEGDT